MKKYKVYVNGNLYEVEIEQADVSEVKSDDKKQTKSSSKPSESSKTSAQSGNGEKITSPMPGNILAVNVNNGDSVKKGQVLMILEAMKMENEIMSPKDGKITGVNVSKGSTVESGTLLCTIE